MLCSRVTAASVSVGERFETTKLIDGVTECQLGAGNGNRKTHDDVTDDQKRKKNRCCSKTTGRIELSRDDNDDAMPARYMLS